MAPAPVSGNLATYSNNASGSSDPALAYPSANQAGSLLVLAASWGTGSGVPTSGTVTDTQGNAWSMLGFQNYSADTQCVALFASYGAKAGANSVTIAWPQACDFRRVLIDEYTGVATASALDGSIASAFGAGSTTTNAITSGNVTTSQSGDLILGVVERTFEDGTSVAGTSPLAYTIRNNVVNGLFLEWAVAGAAGSYAGTWTFTAGTNQHFAAITAAFKAASGGAANPKGGQFVPFF